MMAATDPDVRDMARELREELARDLDQSADEQPLGDTAVSVLHRSELVGAVAAETGQTLEAVNGVLDALFSTVAKSVADGAKVTIPGWIAVEQTGRAARTGRNPQTGEPIEIAASKSVKISAGSKLRASVK